MIFLRQGDIVHLVPKNCQHKIQQFREQFGRGLTGKTDDITSLIHIFGISSKWWPMGSEPEIVCKWRSAWIEMCIACLCMQLIYHWPNSNWNNKIHNLSSPIAPLSLSWLAYQLSLICLRNPQLYLYYPPHLFHQLFCLGQEPSWEHQKFSHH